MIKILSAFRTMLQNIQKGYHPKPEQIQEITELEKLGEVCGHRVGIESINATLKILPELEQDFEQRTVRYAWLRVLTRLGESAKKISYYQSKPSLSKLSETHTMGALCMQLAEIRDAIAHIKFKKDKNIQLFVDLREVLCELAYDAVDIQEFERDQAKQKHFCEKLDQM